MIPKSSGENESKVEPEVELQDKDLREAHRQRKQAEMALRESEAFLRSIYTGTDIAIYLIDVMADGDFVYAGCNPAFEKMSGRKGDSIIGRRPEELDPPQIPEAMAKARANYQRCVATGEAMEYEQKATVRGQETWWLIRLEPLQDKDSHVYRIIATAIPITERKQAEEAYQTLVNHSLQGLAIYQHGRIVFTNVTLAEITGYSTSELLAMSPREVAQMAHPDDLAWVSQKVQDIVAGKSVPPRERFRIVRKGGVIRWVETYGRRIVYNGQPAMQVATVDVTERVLAEAALRESEERFRKVFEEGPLGMSIIDLAYRFVRVNARLCQMLGYTEREMIGLKIADLFHPEEADDHLRQIQQVADGELPYYQSEKRLLGKGSSMIWARVTGTVIRDENKRPVYGLSMVEDITERKNMEQYVLRFERLAAMGRMMAVLAHEIKNPLQAIKSNVELILGYLADPTEQEEYLQLSLEELNRLTDMTGRILKATVPAKEDFHVVSAADLLQQTLSLVNSSLQRAGIRLVTYVPDGLPLVRVVPDQISQVVLNIMENAIEATPRAGYIEISAGLDQGGVRLEFTNSGPSIRPEHLDRIFDPFFTTKSRASGLGLSLSYNIMEQHGGTLSARNRSDGQGVTFTVTLPFNSERVVEQEAV